MTIYVVKTFRGYSVTESEEVAELRADKLYEELLYDCKVNRVTRENVWARIDIYHAEDKWGAPFVYRDSRWANKM